MIVPSFNHTGSRSTEPRDLLALASEGSYGAKFLCDLLRRFEVVTLQLDDGTTAKILASDLVPGNITNERYFTVSNISTADKIKIRVADGSFTAPDVSGIVQESPTLAALMKSFPVDGGDYEAADGSKVYLKLTVTKTMVERAPTSEGGGGTVDGLLTVSGNVSLMVWHATEGIVVVQAGDATNTEELCYIKLATITVADGSVSIRQHRDGEIDTPVVYSLTSSLALSGEVQELTVCIDGSPEPRLFITAPPE